MSRPQIRFDAQAYLAWEAGQTERHESRELGTGVAREIGTGHVFALVERVVSTTVFDSLEVGSPIRFQENGKNVVARIQAAELKG